MLNRSHRNTLSAVGCRLKLICRRTLPESKSAPLCNHKDLLFVLPGPEVFVWWGVFVRGEMALERGCLTQNCGVVSLAAYAKMPCWWTLLEVTGQRHKILCFMLNFAINRLVLLARWGLGATGASDIFFIWKCRDLCAKDELRVVSLCRDVT